MTYYQGDAYGFRGDYYRGDYYRGDPGLFSFVGKALGGVAKLGATVVKGALGIQSQPGVQLQLPVSTGAGTSLFGGMFGGPPGSRGNLPAGGYQLPLGGLALPSTQTVFGRMRGQHPNKTTYETRGGGTSRWPKQLLLHPKGTVQVTNRHMNVGNARALKRALRRAHGFARLAKRVMSLTHPRAHGRLAFKARKRLKA